MKKSIKVSSLVKNPAKGTSAKSSTARGRGTFYSVGLDLGDRYTYYCVLDGDGAVISEGRTRTTPPAMSAYLSNLPTSRVAFEAGSHSSWVERLAKRLKHEAIVANPRELRKIHQSDRKNDRADAAILARMARFDPQLLCPIQHRSEPMQIHLALLRARNALIATRTKLINSARGLVKAVGGRLPSCGSDAFPNKVAEHIPPDLQDVLAPLLVTIAGITEQVRSYDRTINKLAEEKYPATKVLQQVAGVGALTSLAFVLTLADPQRFRCSRDVGPYLGLVPRQDDSGDRVSQLPITKAGDAYLRKLLVGSAHYILGPFGPDCSLRRYGERLALRGGRNAKKRAVVAVARKLAVLLHHLWITGESYDALRSTQPQKAA